MLHAKKNVILYFICLFLCIGSLNLQAMYYQEEEQPVISVNNIQSLKYDIIPINAQNACPGIYDLCVTLDITLSHQPQYAQSLYLLLPYNFSHNTEFKNSLQCSYPTSIEKVFGREDVIKINNITTSTIRIRYRVPSIKNLSTITHTTYRNPIITKNYLHMFGENWMVCPCKDKFGNEFSKQFNITLQWSEFPRNWNFANSFAINTQQQILTKTTRQLTRATYVAGTCCIKRLNCNNQNNQSVFLAILDNTSYYETPQKLENMAQKLMSEYIRFFYGHNVGHQLIAIIPLQNSLFLGGLNYKGSSSLFIGSRYETATPIIAHQLSHELGHIWNGKIIKTKAPKNLMLWLSEGLTEYKADDIALQAKVITPEEHVLLYNNVLRNLKDSFAKNIPHSKIASNPSNPNYELESELKRISYFRGQILAANWNAKIKEATNSQYGLDDVIRALYQRSIRNRNFYVCPKTLIETIQSCLPKNGTIEKLIAEMQEDLHTYIGINPQQHAVQDIHLHPRALMYAEYENTEQLDYWTNPLNPQFTSVPYYTYPQYSPKNQNNMPQSTAFSDPTMQKMRQKRHKKTIYQDFVENRLLYAILRGGSSIYSGVRRILGIFKYVLTEM